MKETTKLIAAGVIGAVLMATAEGQVIPFLLSVFGTVAVLVIARKE